MGMNRADDLFAKLTIEGEAAIDELIATRKSEELFLDFKRSGDDGLGSRLHDSDSKNFSKAISGFANSEGGIIIWGVDCSRSKDGADVASAKIPLQDAAGFASRLESAVSRSTVPPHSGVRNLPVVIPGSVKGFVVSLIPKSNSAPHQTISASQYYMRAGSDFVPVPHGVLAGMFGRRPEPSMRVRKVIPFQADLEGEEIVFDVGIVVYNRGPGIARDIFLTMLGRSMPCAVGSLAFEHLDTKHWIMTQFAGVHMTYLAEHMVRLPPDSYLMPCQLNFRISPPFTSDLHISGTVGCEGGMPFNFVIQNSRENVEHAYKGVQNAKFLNLNLQERLHEFPRRVLGIISEDQSLD